MKKTLMIFSVIFATYSMANFAAAASNDKPGRMMDIKEPPENRQRTAEQQARNKARLAEAEAREAQKKRDYDLRMKKQALERQRKLDAEKAKRATIKF